MELKAKLRTELGKKVKVLRRAGFLPAVLYGEGIQSQPITVTYKDFEKTYKEAGESTLITLEVEGKPYNVLIHDIKNDPLKGTPLHADFYAVRMDKTIRTKVPLEFFGESAAVKNEGGVLVKVMKELEVEALPKDLPRELRIDISLLKSVGAKFMVKNVVLPEGVRILADPEDVVLLIEAPRTEEELALLKEVATKEGVLEVKTEQEIKRAAKLEKDTIEGETETPVGTKQEK